MKASGHEGNAFDGDSGIFRCRCCRTGVDEPSFRCRADYVVRSALGPGVFAGWPHAGNGAERQPFHRYPGRKKVPADPGSARCGLRRPGGLGDVALLTDFENNKTIYLSYAEGGVGDTRGAAVARAVPRRSDGW